MRGRYRESPEEAEVPQLGPATEVWQIQNDHKWIAPYVVKITNST